MTDIENITHVKPGEVRWVKGRKRVTVGQRFGKSLTGLVFPTTEYECTYDDGSNGYEEFQYLLTLEDALSVASEQAPTIRAQASTANAEAHLWELALSQIEDEARRREEAQRGILENAVPLMNAVDEQIMDFLPSDATGYVIVGTTVPSGSLYADEDPRVQYLFGVYPNGKVNINAQPIVRGEERYFGDPAFVSGETNYGVRLEFDLQTGYTQAKDKPAGFIAKLDTDETNDD